MNWAMRLLRARQHKKFLKADIQKARFFTTCAVGEAFGPNTVRQEEDSLLSRLGVRFWEAVENQEIAKAELLYLQINAENKQKGGT